MKSKSYLIASIIVVLAIPMLFMGATREDRVDNYSGWTDTSNIAAFKGTALKYSKVFRLTDFEDLRAILKVNDTTSAGFASDSLAIVWGYQTGSIIINSSGLCDTVWDDRIQLDSLLSANLGSTTIGVHAASGAITRSLQSVDTSNVTGFACQDRWFVPEWDVLIRFWVQGITGNVNTNINTQVQILRKLGVAVSNR